MGPRYCDHTFVCIQPLKEINNHPVYEAKIVSEGAAQMSYKPAHFETILRATIACMYCGQIRHVEPNGTVTIAVEEGKIIKKRNEQPNDTSQKI